MKTYRIFSIVAYQDSETLEYNSIYNNLIKTNYTYFIIKHDNDENKIHYHIAIYTTTPTTISVIAKKLNISDNFISIQDDSGNRYTLKKTIGYLIHYNNKEKFNYKIDDILTNNKDIVLKYYDLLTGGNSESQELKEILLFMENNKCNCKDLLSFCIENNLLKTFRKYSYYLNQIIKEYQYERTF